MGSRVECSFRYGAEVVDLHLHRADSSCALEVMVNSHADGDIRDTGRDSAVENSLAVRQFLFDLAAQSDAVFMFAAHLNSEQFVERDVGDEFPVHLSLLPPSAAS